MMDNHIRSARILAKLLDSQYSLFGIKFGLDPILDIIPGIGDIVSSVLSLYIVCIAVKLELPRHEIWIMLWHIAVNFVIGILPVIGPIGDVFYKSNLMNLKILEKYRGKIIDGEIIS